jgi:predicted AlkP superfamily pyrophosphatase or phosphodiesterase
MMRAVCALLILVVAATGAPAEPPVKKLLLIGIDGCRFDAVTAADTPHLDTLIRTGAFTAEAQILGMRYFRNDTVSGPGWSSILTGVWADKHGVDDNKFTRPNYDQYPHFFARLKQRHPQARTVSLVTWTPIEERMVRSADVHEAFASNNAEEYIAGDARAARRAAELLEHADPTAMFLYLGQVDETGHKHGFHPSVRPYLDAIERVDTLMGDVLAAIRRRQTYAAEDWLVIVTSDHGGRGTDHSKGHQVPEIRNSFLIVSGPSAARGRLEGPVYIVDAPVTGLVHLGVELDEAWQLDGRPVGLRP